MKALCLNGAIKWDDRTVGLLSRLAEPASGLAKSGILGFPFGGIIGLMRVYRDRRESLPLGSPRTPGIGYKGLNEHD
jgi:hypothetical protein